MNGDGNYIYDAFISYSHTDREWVQKDLLFPLQQAGLQVIIDYRDFDPGVPLVKEIERAAEQSRKTLLVLTQSYIDSKWTEFENVMLFTLSVLAQADRIVPILKQKCDLPLRIKSLVYVDLTYLKGSEEYEAEFDRLLKVLGCGGGKIIVQLLQTLEPRLEGLGSDFGSDLDQSVRNTYNEARKSILCSDYENAIKVCEKTLIDLAEPSSSPIVDLSYARGIFHLLMASVYLDRVGYHRQAARSYLISIEHFKIREWNHLQSLAQLGLAISERKSERPEEADAACKDAQTNIEVKSIPDWVNRTYLRRAIAKERAEILKCLLAKGQQQVEKSVSLDDSIKEKVLPIFNITRGQGLITAGRATDLNLLSLRDWEATALTCLEKVVVDSTKRSAARHADYILEVGDGARVGDGLEAGDWLPIRDVTDPGEMNGRTVVVLMKKGGEVSVSLKIFVEAEDHYLLKARSGRAPSIILIHYASVLGRISDYYTLYEEEEKVTVMRADDVQVCGAVYGNQCIPKSSIKAITKGYVWQVPRVSDIAAGQRRPIADEDVIDFVDLRETGRMRNNCFFVVVVKGDSMIGDQILPESRALIRQQTKVDNGDIAAVVITTPEMDEPSGVLKRYRVVNEESQDLRHWLLESSNPSRDSLVIIPDGGNAQEIRDLYSKETSGRKIKFLEDTEPIIAGKYIKSLAED